MTPEERGRLSVAIEHVFRDRMKDTLDEYALTEEEQLQIASAVVALMLRKLYRSQGARWLESIIRSAMQPDDA